MGAAETMDEEDCQACSAGRLPAVEDLLAVDVRERHFAGVEGVASRKLEGQAGICLTAKV